MSHYSKTDLSGDRGDRLGKVAGIPSTLLTCLVDRWPSASPDRVLTLPDDLLARIEMLIATSLVAKPARAAPYLVDVVVVVGELVRAARDARDVMGVKAAKETTTPQMDESVLAEMGALRRPKRSSTPKWQTTSTLVRATRLPRPRRLQLRWSMTWT